MSYSAIICELKNLREHPNADRLQLATVMGNTIVVGLDAIEGTLGVFFPTDGQLSEEFATANDLVRRKDEHGNNVGGMFDANRRVRAQSLRGQKSEGFWTELQSLRNLDIDTTTLAVGTQFTSLVNTHGETVPICNKYFSPQTLKAMNNRANNTGKRINTLFPEHQDTAQLRFVISDIPRGSLITITEKIHGTSQRVANQLDEKIKMPPRWKFWKKPEVSEEYSHMVGTRRVILADRTHSGYYGSESWRFDAVYNLEDNLHKGEIVYGELVGYLPDGRPIMSNHDTSSLKDLKKVYGPKMHYSYGQEEGQCEFIIYRITNVSPDGFELDYSWPQVKARAAQLGFNVVPELYPTFIYDGNEAELQELVKTLGEGASLLDHRHISEGVCLRVDSPDGKTNIYKDKSFAFKVMEGIIKTDDAYVDLEEIS